MGNAKVFCFEARHGQFVHRSLSTMTSLRIHLWEWQRQLRASELTQTVS
jgi:hypothetical protein